jgi:hypothetical protein
VLVVGATHSTEGNVNENSRFGAAVSDDEIQELIDSNKNANTRKNTQWAFSVFETWRLERSRTGQLIPEFKMMTCEQMNFYLGRFIVEARRQDGAEYPPRSLYLIACGLLRYLRDGKVFDVNFLDTRDHRFAEFRKILDSRMKDLLKRGVGTSVKRAEPFHRRMRILCGTAECLVTKLQRVCSRQCFSITVNCLV